MQVQEYAIKCHKINELAITPSVTLYTDIIGIMNFPFPYYCTLDLHKEEESYQ